ncbi:TIGR00266 family protein [Lentilactobacillus senioris]|uniref:TIGR00266 family protein n=1 Tax=Lentilactobacillus senioris TaxID=931534 RepID=UPI00227DD552|nr:TIGR00266 family protein [Lentilactobacillus senioris]MCY9806223.1 TIGR00266 family protein [Lentilactobacillus senioris]
MDYELKGDVPFPMALVHLNANDKVQIENGSMIYFNNSISLDGHLNSNGKKGLGGLMSAIGRGVTSGESMFITTATSSADGGEIAIAPGNPGVIQELEVNADQQWRLNTGAFLASDESVSYNMVRQKASGALFGGTGGFFIMETQGTGTMLVSAYGDLMPLDLNDVKDYAIDNDHVVAWSQNLDYNIEPASGVIGFKTGEGLVTRFTGSGRVYVQTRNLKSLADLLKPYLPTNTSD